MEFTFILLIMPGQPNNFNLRPFREGANFLDEHATQRMNDALAAVHALGVTVGFGLFAWPTPSGVLIEIDPTVVSTAVTPTKYQWDVEMTPVGDPITSYDFEVWPGLIAGFLPSNMFSSFSVPASGTRYLVATCATDGRTVSSSTLAVETSPPTFATPQVSAAAAELKFTIGVFVDGVYFNVWKKNVAVNTREVLREDKSSPGPLELPYISWWGWTVS